MNSPLTVGPADVPISDTTVPVNFVSIQAAFAIGAAAIETRTVAMRRLCFMRLVPRLSKKAASGTRSFHSPLLDYLLVTVFPPRPRLWCGAGDGLPPIRPSHQTSF